MASIIHARLDKETESLFEALQCQLGWNDSQIVREGIKALSAATLAKPGRKIIGVGKFESGVADLGSNQDHLNGFGK